ncbi:MAG: TetR family transcriptional regulator [Thermodesulfobacteriota bacterium]|nr:MAG: TetR family transcriptional regulator [Thermodesulfobacteriota bacterium]
MARNKSVDDETLIIKLTQAFRDYGYEGASLNILAKATGLQKASLYHRFPGGKEEMALEVLNRAGNWVGENIVLPLTSNIKPEKKIKIMAKKLDEFYSGGNNSCLLNMLASPEMIKGPFTSHIKEAFEVWIKTLSDVLVESGLSRKESRKRAENAIAMLQGSLVMSRGMNDPKLFKNFLKNLPNMLLDNNKL